MDVAEALTTGNHVEAGRLANESFAGARDLYEVVSSEMIAMQKAILSAPGTLGVRGAGAGFGGCMTAFVEDGHEEAFVGRLPTTIRPARVLFPRFILARLRKAPGYFLGSDK